jgi:hypothetical protein
MINRMVRVAVVLPFVQPLVNLLVKIGPDGPHAANFHTIPWDVILGSDSTL